MIPSMAGGHRMTIKELLQLRKMSQAELARRAQTTPATVSRVLSGARQPSLRMLRQLATALELPDDVLYRLLRDQQRGQASA